MEPRTVCLGGHLWLSVFPKHAMKCLILRQQDSGEAKGSEFLDNRRWFHDLAPAKTRGTDSQEGLRYYRGIHLPDFSLF
eukprot:5159998-Amphidinium_carterae.1